VRGEDVASAPFEPDPTADKEVPCELMRPFLGSKVRIVAELLVDGDSSLIQHHRIEQIVEELDGRRTRLGRLAGGRENNEEVSQCDNAERPERLKDTACKAPVGREDEEEPKVLRHKRDKEECLGDTSGVFERTERHGGAR